MNIKSEGILSLSQGIACLRAEGVVAIPTETVYGLAARADSAQAVAKIFEAKKRPFFDPLIVHIADPQDVLRVVAEFPESARQLANRFWPGPLTLVLPKRPEIADLVTAGLPTVGVRCPSHPMARSLIRDCGYPLAAPSANLFGQISPTTADDVLNQLMGRIDGVVDGGPCQVGVESTIVAFWNGKISLLRPGGIPVEAIEEVVGPVERWINPSSSESTLPAPGTMPRHYSPRTTTVFFEIESEIPTDSKWRSESAFIALSEEKAPTGFAHVEALSKNGEIMVAAARLYSVLHKLDAQGFKRLVALALPVHGLGLAINDRLRRAAGSTTDPLNLKPNKESTP